MGVKQSKRSVDISSTPAKGEPTVPTNGKITAAEDGDKVVDEKITANGDAVEKTETNGEVKNGDAVKENGEEKKAEDGENAANETKEGEEEAASGKTSSSKFRMNDLKGN